MSTYKAAVLISPTQLSIQHLPHRELQHGELLIKVEKCGVCRGDSVAFEGHMPGLKYPRVPGHEVVGIVEKIGEGVPSSRGFSVGQRVGRGWHGGHCFGCERCLRGDFLQCKNALVTGLTVDGGYAEYLYAPWHSLAIIPDGLSSANASALMCAGLTVFHGLRVQKIMAPAVVAVHGIGGLGHLAIQFAARMGYIVAALSTGSSKSELAKKLGAHHYIDTSKQNAVKELQALGGAACIIATSFVADSTASLYGGLATDGILLVCGADHQGLKISPLQLIHNRGRVIGHASGHPADAEDTLIFASKHGIETMEEIFPLDKAQEAYDHMMKGTPKFRVVLDCVGKH